MALVLLFGLMKIWLILFLTFSTPIWEVALAFLEILLCIYKIDQRWKG